MSAFGGAYGMTCIGALQFSNVYGPRSYRKASVIAKFLKQILDGEELVVYGNGSQRRDFAYVGDIVIGHYRYTSSSYFILCIPARRRGIDRPHITSQ